MLKQCYFFRLSRGGGYCIHTCIFSAKWSPHPVCNWCFSSSDLCCCKKHRVFTQESSKSTRNFIILSTDTIILVQIISAHRVTYTHCTQHRNLYRPTCIGLTLCTSLQDSSRIYYLRRRRLCFHFGLFVCLSVCLFVCPSDNWKSCERILTKFLGGVGHSPGTNEFNFSDDPDHSPDPGVRSPKSGFTGLSKKLPTNFDEILWRAGVWPI